MQKTRTVGRLPKVGNGRADKVRHWILLRRLWQGFSGRWMRRAHGSDGTAFGKQYKHRGASVCTHRVRAHGCDVCAGQWELCG